MTLLPLQPSAAQTTNSPSYAFLHALSFNLCRSYPIPQPLSLGNGQREFAAEQLRSALNIFLRDPEKNVWWLKLVKTYGSAAQDFIDLAVSLQISLLRSHFSEFLKSPSPELPQVADVGEGNA